jgi:uncharacterized protein (DUF1697 family)
MPTYAAFLRGVSPVNAKMSELKRALEAGGLREVRTLLASGNVVFETRTTSPSSLERKVEKAMEQHLGRVFMTLIRPVETLKQMLASDPFEPFDLPANAKRIVTFLRTPPATRIGLPLELHGARILKLKGTEVFSAYLPSPHGPVFMSLIEKTFGKEVTTRTWDTVRKVAGVKHG